MATIKKKSYEPYSANYPYNENALFSTAAELLGSEWESGTQYLRKKTPTGYYGWQLANASNADASLWIAGRTYGTNAPSGNVVSNHTVGEHTCVVWEGDNGSVGIGEEISGKIKLRLILAKFKGKHDGKDVYAIGNRSGDERSKCLRGYNGTDIATDINMRDVVTGTGVYLHQLLEPTTGLTCADVFGVQCCDGYMYGTTGTIIKQGGNTYMSVLGNSNSSANTDNLLFIKL